MFDVMRENPRRALIVLAIPVVIVVIYLTATLLLTYDENDGYVGAVLDDTWIHVRFADSISKGEGMSYNEGVVTPGGTSPLWVLTLGFIYAITNPSIMAQLHIAIGLSAIGTVLTVLSITAFGWWTTRKAWVGLLAGTITALTGRFIWMGLSGMEMTAFTALCILALWSHIYDIRQQSTFGWRTGIITALATLARPEGYLLAVLIGLDAFIIVPLIERAAYWQRIRYGWRGIVSYLLLAGSYPLATLAMTGHLLPNTFRVKSQLGKEIPDLPYAYFWTPRVDHGWLLIIMAGLGIAFLLWRTWTRRENTGFIWALWPVIFVLAVLFLGSQHFVINNGRYVSPAIPFHALAAAIGLWALREFINRYDFDPLLDNIPAIIAVLLVGFAYFHGKDHATGFSNDVGQLKAMHVAAGHWFAENTATDETIALNDVGAITHISNRRVLDMMGLVSPEMIDAIKDEERHTCPYDLQIARVMLEQRPVFIAIFPWWYQCMVDWPGMLQAEKQFDITGPTVIAGGSLVVYRPLWQNWPMQPEIAAAAIPITVGFEHGIDLSAYQTEIIDDNLQITLWWTPQRQPQGDYTVFIHLLDGNGEIITQSDSRPQAGQFNTFWWHEGDIIPDKHLIPLDDATMALIDKNEASLRIGLYPTGGGPNLLRMPAPMDEPEFTILPLLLDD
jgi:hypothetical protein